MRRLLAETAAVVIVWAAIFSSLPQIYTQAQRWLCFCGFECSQMFPLAVLIAGIIAVIIGIGVTVTSAVWVVAIWSEDK